MKSIALLCLSAALAAAEPVMINDGALMRTLQKGLEALAKDGKQATADDLAKSLKTTPAKTGKLALAQQSPKDLDQAIFLVGSVYNCGQCEKLHPGGIATAWVLAENGVMVSNYHVFEMAEGAVMGVCGRDGKIFPITKLLAADKASDIVIFQVETSGLTPLALGTIADVGAKIQVISHPENRFFMHTFGEVGRYHFGAVRSDAKPAAWMVITADFAKGSSGGPVLDNKGRVVGMVSNTQSIYFDSSEGENPKGPLQMVIKDCVPIPAITALIAGMPATATEPAKENAAP